MKGFHRLLRVPTGLGFRAMCMWPFGVPKSFLQVHVPGTQLPAEWVYNMSHNLNS